MDQANLMSHLGLQQSTLTITGSTRPTLEILISNSEEDSLLKEAENEKEVFEY